MAVNLTQAAHASIPISLEFVAVRILGETSWGADLNMTLATLIEKH